MPFQAIAIDGYVYIGKYFGDVNTKQSAPGSDTPPAYETGILIGQDIWRFHPWVEITTLMDEKVDTARFHPASVDYKVGIDLDIYKGIFATVEHSCWHPIDESTEVNQYNILKVGYEF